MHIPVTFLAEEKVSFWFFSHLRSPHETAKKKKKVKRYKGLFSQDETLTLKPK